MGHWADSATGSRKKLETMAIENRVQQVTAAQASAIAVFKIQGEAAQQIAAEHLQLIGSKALSEREINRIHVGYWRHDLASGSSPVSAVDSLSALPQTAAFWEDVVLCRTGATHLELHTHGSVAVADSILHTFSSRGIDCEVMGPGANEISPLIAFPSATVTGPLINDQKQLLAICARSKRLAPDFRQTHRPESLVSWVQTLAGQVIMLSSAPAAGEVLLAQAAGIFVNELAAISGYLERAEQDASHRADGIKSSLAAIDHLQRTWRHGRHLIQPHRVLLTGPPNVGKSSLINALLGYSRALVSSMPGTTRDLFSQETIVAGWPFVLFDSAGIRSASDRLEQEGIRRASAAAETMDLVIEVTSAEFAGDGDFTLPPADANPNSRRFRVINKIDLSGDTETLPQATGRSGDGVGIYRTSALTGAGIKHLLDAIAAHLLPAPLDGLNSAMVFHQDLQDWLERIGTESEE